GTGKPEHHDRYHLLDFKPPEEPYGAGEFVRLARVILEEAFPAGRSVVVVGGTGLYIRALFEEYADLSPLPPPELRAELTALPLCELVSRLREQAPDLAARTDLGNPVRVSRALERLAAPPVERFTLPPFRKLKIALDPPDLPERVRSRVRQMLDSGWREEVASLTDRGVSLDAPAFRAIGYRDVATGNYGTLEEAVVSLTLRYAKRQRTWLRSEPNLRCFSDASAAILAVREWIAAH
ncbi:MAG: hypothetical protein C4320_02025, partial [Armatimonadota bacterium]